MLVHALIASVRTGPEPAVFPVLDCFDEVFADFVSRGFGIAVFAYDDLAEFFCCLVSVSESPFLQSSELDPGVVEVGGLPSSQSTISSFFLSSSSFSFSASLVS